MMKMTELKQGCGHFMRTHGSALHATCEHEPAHAGRTYVRMIATLEKHGVCEGNLAFMESGKKHELLEIKKQSCTE